MVHKLKEIESKNNSAMVYIVDKKRTPKGVKIPKRPFVIKTVGSIRGLKFKRSDRKLIVADTSTVIKLTQVLSDVKKIMFRNGYTSIAIVKQGDMSYQTFHNSVESILGDTQIDIETYDA